MKLFFNYSIDCELPVNTPYTGTERCSFFGGPASWKVAEASVRGFVSQMKSLNAAAGTSLFVYPDVAREQKALYCEMARAGAEIALHLHGLRYSKLRGDRAQWLGAMSYAEQKEALRMGKEDLEQVIGQPCLGYRACYGSANCDTFRICEELGFEWNSNASGRYRPDLFANWQGSWPYVHHAHAKSNLIPGDLKLVELPVTRGLRICFNNNPDQPFDLRVESSPAMVGEDRKIYHDIVEENLVEMERRKVPVRTVIGASHNTNPFNDSATHQAQNLEWIVRHSRELARKHKLELVPASCREIQQEALRIGSY